MEIWTSREPTSKFRGSICAFLEFGDRDDTPCQVHVPHVNFTHVNLTSEAGVSDYFSIADANM